MHEKITAQQATPSPETTTSTPAQAPQGSKKAAKNKKPDKSDHRVPMTFSVSIGFAKKLKMLSGSLDESTSEYLESKMAALVTRDLKKVMEDME